MRYAAVYKCRRCEKLITIGPFEQSENRTLHEELENSAIYQNWNRAEIDGGRCSLKLYGGAHECNDGGAGLIEFCGLEKAEDND